MSRSFELLRRAGKAEELFLPTLKAHPLDGPGVRGNGEPARREGSGPQKLESVRRIDEQPAETPAAQEDGRPVREEAIEFTAEPWPRPESNGRGQQEVLKLVRRVFVAPNSHAPRAVTFSSVEGNGSSEICLRTGEALAAQRFVTVCLVDANLQAPFLHRLSGVPKSPGLAEAATESGPIRDFAVRLNGGNLWVVPPGSLAEGAPTFAAWSALRSRMAELRAIFDYVLVDTPPVASDGDALLLGQMTEGVILVVEANSTRRKAARIAKEAFEAANVPLFGAILNNRTFPIPEALYERL
jgi:Mrp family chromosome partitioning ATPase